MTGRILIGLSLALVLVVTLFLLPYAPSFFRLNAFAIGIVIALLFGETRLALIAAIVGGVIMDLVSPWPFGTYLLTFVCGLALTRWISRTRVTNRSFLAYSSLIIIAMAMMRIFEYSTAQILRVIDTAALAPLMSTSWWTGLATHLMQAFTIGVLVYVGVRLSGRSYATLADHEF